MLYLDEALATRYGGHDDQLSARHWGLDRFRVAALEKMLDGPGLPPSDRRLTLETLTAKLHILVNGACKRGNRGVADAYRQQLLRCRKLLEEDEAAAGAARQGRNAAPGHA